MRFRPHFGDLLKTYIFTNVKPHRDNPRSPRSDPSGPKGGKPSLLIFRFSRLGATFGSRMVPKSGKVAFRLPKGCPETPKGARMNTNPCQTGAKIIEKGPQRGGTWGNTFQPYWVPGNLKAGGHSALFFNEFKRGIRRQSNKQHLRKQTRGHGHLKIGGRSALFFDEFRCGIRRQSKHKTHNKHKDKGI